MRWLRSCAVGARDRRDGLAVREGAATGVRVTEASNTERTWEMKCREERARFVDLAGSVLPAAAEPGRRHTVAAACRQTPPRFPWT